MYNKETIKFVKLLPASSSTFMGKKELISKKLILAVIHDQHKKYLLFKSAAFLKARKIT